MPMSPTQLTLRKLRNEGYRAAVVEKWNAHIKIRQDLFGFIDVIGVREGETIAVQACTFGDRLKRARKVREAEALPNVLAAQWKVVVHGWRKQKNRWQCTEESIDVCS